MFNSLAKRWKMWEGDVVKEWENFCPKLEVVTFSNRKWTKIGSKKWKTWITDRDEIIL